MMDNTAFVSETITEKEAGVEMVGCREGLNDSLS